jgi:hypothetical protein
MVFFNRNTVTPKELFFHPLVRLTKPEKIKLIITTVVCSILLSPIGGLIAFFAGSAYLKNRHITPIPAKKNPIDRVAHEILTPGEKISMSPKGKDLLDSFGIRPEEDGSFDSNRLESLVTSIREKTPPHIFEERLRSEKIGKDPAKLEEFLQRVNDYNLTLCYPETAKKWTSLSIQEQADKIRAEKFSDEKARSTRSIFLNQEETNGITSIPIEIFSCKNISSFIVESKNLLGISTKIGTLTGLLQLAIKNSSFLQELPPEIGNLIALKGLTLVGNTSLRRLPSEVTNIERLYTIDMRECTAAEEIPHDLLTKLKSLKALYLLHCEKISVPEPMRKQIEERKGFVVIYPEMEFEG